MCLCVQVSRSASCGILEKIRLVNFMCHKRLEVDFNSNVNFIHGRNGSKCFCEGCSIRFLTTSLKVSIVLFYYDLRLYAIVLMHVCVCVCVCLCVCVCVCVCVYLSVCVLCGCIFIHMYVCI